MSLIKPKINAQTKPTGRISAVANSTLTRDFGTIVLFTATHIRSLTNGIATTSSDTCSSTAEKTGEYNPIALVERGGKVAAFGDITFLMEPYCYVEDNHDLVTNIVNSFIDLKTTG